MSLDGAFLSKIKNELEFYIGAHLDKIYQPSKDELVFLLRSKEGTARLLLSCRQGSARVHFTSFKPDNPPTPPMFCMLLRKYLSSARLVSVDQAGLERVITLTFSSLNEMGDIIYPKVICELIGSQPNIILTDSDYVILDAVRRSDIESSLRLIQPGAHYLPPASPEKLNILSVKTDLITREILNKETRTLSDAVLDTLEGISPLVAREIALKVANDFAKPVSDLTDGEKMNITGVLNGLLRDIKENNKPYLLTDKNGMPKEFSFTEITQYSPQFKGELLGSFSETLDAFYQRKENAERIRRAALDIYKLLTVLMQRTQRKTLFRKKDLAKCADREKYRIYGELIKANLYCIKAGSKNVTLSNYYDENLAEIVIPLDPAISPAANADKYFKEYKKSYTAEKMLIGLIEEDEKDLIYFESVLDALSRAETLSELNDIREELIEAGVLHLSTKQKKAKVNDTFREYLSPKCNKILVGKNNKQNDKLTLNFSKKTDIWFHTKNIPGSHTVLICDNGEVTKDELIFAASIAAYHSKAQNSSSVPVDYTLIKYVKKPNGAKPGMVIYSNEKTLFVTPNLSKNETI